MSYYSLTLPSKKEDILSKTFTIDDYISVIQLVNTDDIKGLDLFVEEKFKEYTKKDITLYSADKFAYLLAQRIISNNEKITLKTGTDSTFSLDLFKIYQDLLEHSFKIEEVIDYKGIKIKIGLPFSLSFKDNIQIHSINDKILRENSKASDLPQSAFNKITEFYNFNNNLIVQDYFSSIFKGKFTFNNESFLFLIKFIYGEDISSIYENFFTLCKGYNYDIGVMKGFTLRELYLHIILVNNYVKEQNKKKQ